MTDHKLAIADTYRGKILAAAIYVEDWLDTVITAYFTKGVSDEKRVDEKGKVHFILIQKGGWDFNSKCEIVRRFILVEEYMSRKTRSALITDLQKVAEVRNKIAHWRINEHYPDTMKLEGKPIVFKQISWEDKSWTSNYFEVNEAVVDQELKRSESVVERLREIDGILWK